MATSSRIGDMPLQQRRLLGSSMLVALAGWLAAVGVIGGWLAGWCVQRRFSAPQRCWWTMATACRV